MVTQLLFGELFFILEEQERWTHIRTEADDYECWISSKQYKTINEQLFAQLQLEKKTFSYDLVQVIQHKENQQAFPVVLGSYLPQFNKRVCATDDEKYIYEGETISPEGPAQRDKIAENAFMYLNSPYLWGGRSPFGIDCSGFTQMVYKLSGMQLKRDAWQQAERGATLSFVEEAETGDLAFFDNDDGRIIHTGIILPGNKIIHASGKVRIDHFDHHGIFNVDTKTYSHNLRIIKRII